MHINITSHHLGYIVLYNTIEGIYVLFIIHTGCSCPDPECRNMSLISAERFWPVFQFRQHFTFIMMTILRMKVTTYNQIKANIKTLQKRSTSATRAEIKRIKRTTFRKHISV